MPDSGKKGPKKYRKPGESFNITANREAAARQKTGGMARIETVRWLSAEDAARASAGTGPSAKQKRRLR